ncbi:MAG: hypothetical protein K2Q10_01395 [Rhodospirillales bacterium]|nr:hypothetical protein [Rhodospirillales bacterium]
MSGFRTHDGQQSDRIPIKRSVEEKKLLLRKLKEQQAGLKPWVADTIKQSLAKRIADIEEDLISTASRPPRK